jgi:hypothetical protein
MTCIVAGKGWLAADRLFTDEQGRAERRVKLAKNKHLIAAACGTGTSIMAVRAAVRRGAKTPEELQACVDAESELLVVTATDTTWHVQNDEVWQCKPGMHAVGTGGDLALGYLAHMIAFDPALIRSAFRFVASRRNDCGGGVDIRRIGGV